MITLQAFKRNNIYSVRHSVEEVLIQFSNFRKRKIHFICF